MLHVRHGAAADRQVLHRVRTSRHRHANRGGDARYLLAEIHSPDTTAPADTALRHYQKALTLATKLGMKPLIARCNAGLATLWMRAGKPRQTDLPLITARAMYRAMGMRYWLGKLDTDVAELAS